MCVLFYFSFIGLYVYAFATKSMDYGGSAFEPGASGLPYYCTPPVSVPDVIGALTVWRQTHKKKTPGGVWVGVWFRFRLYYPFGKGLGQH